MLNIFIQLVQSVIRKRLPLHNWVLLPYIDNISMSVGHLDHVLLTVYFTARWIGARDLKITCRSHVWVELVGKKKLTESKAKNTRGKHKSMAVVPLCERTELKSHGIATANRNHRTLRISTEHCGSSEGQWQGWGEDRIDLLCRMQELL